MKIGLWVEGSTDESFFSNFILRTLNCTAMDICVRTRRGNCIDSLKVGLSAAVKEFKSLGCEKLLLTADNHRVSPSERARKSAECEAIAAPTDCIVSVAIESLESWLLADFSTLAQILGASDVSQPPSVETLSDPKQALKDLFKVYPSHDQLGEFAQRMDLRRARRQSRSFDQFLRNLNTWE